MQESCIKVEALNTNSLSTLDDYSTQRKTQKGLLPAAIYVQQPWNVYSQAYMKAASESATP